MAADRLLLLSGPHTVCLRADFRRVVRQPDAAGAFGFRKMELVRNGNLCSADPGRGAFNAAVSQVSNSTPLYGNQLWPAYPERFGSAVGDIVSQNFFGDFLLASAFHEDTRYQRRGPNYRLWARVGYAVSRSVITRTDAGGATFNAANVIGTGMSAALSNAYYPPISRTARVAAMNWGTSVAGSGLANLLPEFWPDFHAWVKRHLQRGGAR